MTPERKALANEAEALKLAGLSFADIGRKLNVPTTTVQRWLKEYQTPRPEPSPDNPYGLSGADYGLLDPKSNKHELALVRSYLAKAHAEGAPPTIIAELAKKVNDLITSGVKIDIITGQLITRDAMLKLGEGLVTIVMEEIRHLPGYEEIVDKIAARIGGQQTRNEAKEVKRLIGPPPTL